MSYRILIIEDNHSFIDSLKVMLKVYSFQVDSVYRFRNAESELAQKGAYLPNNAVNQLLQYEADLNHWQNARSGNKKKEKAEPENGSTLPIGAPEPPKLSSELVNPNGYIFILIEQDAETSLKGLDFIKNIVKAHPSFHYDNFILMGNNLNNIVDEASKLGIATIQKPFREQDIKELIEKKLAALEELKVRVENLFQLSQAVLDTQEAESSPKRKSPKKKTSLKNTKKATKKSSPKTTKKRTKSTKEKSQ